MAYYLATTTDDNDETTTTTTTTTRRKEEEAVSSKIVTPWPLGGITMFSRTIIVDEKDGTVNSGGCSSSHNIIVGKWKCEFYGNTDHMPGEYKKGIGKWSLPSFDDTV